MTQKTHWKKAFNKDYLGAHDVEEGQELKVVIASVTQREVTNPNGEKSACNVARFTDTSVKPMILNTTACKQVQRFTGQRYIENWQNVPIQIYVQENVRAFGETVDALRIRDHQPRLEKPRLNKQSDKWNDAVASYQKAEDKTKHIEVIRKHYELSDSDLTILIDAAEEELVENANT